jgi:hypothetical protein
MPSDKTGKSTATLLLLAALAAPIALFWLFASRTALGVAPAAAIAIAAGWALNIAWASAVQRAAAGDPSQAGTLKIAVRFGWICPLVLAGLTWVALRLLAPDGT